MYLYVRLTDFRKHSTSINSLSSTVQLMLVNSNLQWTYQYVRIFYYMFWVRNSNYFTLTLNIVHNNINNKSIEDVDLNSTIVAICVLFVNKLRWLLQIKLKVVLKWYRNNHNILYIYVCMCLYVYINMYLKIVFCQQPLTQVFLGAID